MTTPVEVLERESRVNDGRAEFDVTVPAESVFFQGHFDGYPIFPAIAQIDAVVLPRVERAWPDLAVPSEISRIKFLRSIRPGAEFTVVLMRDGARVKFELRDGAGALCTGDATYPGAP